MSDESPEAPAAELEDALASIRSVGEDKWPAQTTGEDDGESDSGIGDASDDGATKRHDESVPTD